MNTIPSPTAGRERRAVAAARSDHIGVAVVNGKLYAFGGFAATIHAGPADVALEYDPAADSLAST